MNDKERRRTAIEHLRICKTNKCGKFRECEKCVLIVPKTALMRHLLAMGKCPNDPPMF